MAFDMIRKGICQNIAPNCVFTPVRLWLYRLCGFKIGKIGENAVVGAGSLVLHSVPPNTVYAGNPARFIKENNRK